MSRYIILIKTCQVPRCATEDDKEVMTLPRGTVLEVISKDAPLYITEEGFCIPFESAFPIDKKKETDNGQG